MSEIAAGRRAREAAARVKEVMLKAEASAQRAANAATPAMKSLDRSMEAASKSFLKTVKAIDGATTGDQVKLLRAYRKFLGGQVDFVEARIKSLEGKGEGK